MSDFELTMQEAPRMNTRLRQLADLVGETILATFDNYDTKDGHVVIVTDTFNWLVLDAEADGCGEDPSVEVVRGFEGDDKVLADFVSPGDLFQAGCINADVHRVLQEKEDARQKELAMQRANRLRAELAKLEGGAT